MTTLTDCRMLTRYKAWADRLIYDGVAALPEGEATKPRTTLFSNIVHTLNHILVIDRIFQAHLEGREHGYAARNTPEPLPFEELRRAQESVDRWYIDWSNRMTEPELEEKIAFTFVGGGDGVMTRNEILLHVVNHTSYHRGFVADMFFQVPARPPTTDLPVFLRDVPQDLE